MNHNERALLYQRLYFTEIDRREKINARLALPFAVIVAIVGLLSYLFHAPEKPGMAVWSYAFWVLYLGAAAALLVGAWFFRKAWFGHTDRLLPTAGHIEEYHRQLIDMYANYDNADDLVDAYLGVSEFLCVRHTMTTRSQYAEQTEGGQRGRKCA